MFTRSSVHWAERIVAIKQLERRLIFERTRDVRIVGREMLDDFRRDRLGVDLAGGQFLAARVGFRFFGLAAAAVREAFRGIERYPSRGPLPIRGVRPSVRSA